MPAKIIIAGEGGQGVQIIAKIIAKTAQYSGKHSTYLPSFGVEQRGGATKAYVQMSSRPIAYPRFSKADFVVLMSNRGVDVVKDQIGSHTVLIYDNSAIANSELSKIKDETKDFVAVEALDTAKEKFNVKSANMILLGVLSARLKDLSFETFQKVITEEFKNKGEDIVKTNLQAFEFGVGFAEKYNAEGRDLAGKETQEVEKSFDCEKIKWTRYPEYCKGCSLCIIKCPVNALTFSADENFLGTPLPIIDTQKCIGCGLCSDICPDGAIKIEKK